MHSIAIIGSGPTAIYTAHYLLSQNHPVSIVMFEKQAEAGKGTPYHPDWNGKEMLSNIASIEIPPITQTLQGWLSTRSDEELGRVGVSREAISDRAFFPRIALGEYFHSQLHQLKRLSDGNKKSLILKTRHKVLDATIISNGVAVTVREDDGTIHNWFFDYAVMATGHSWPAQTEARPGYFLSPWPASSLKTISHCHVGIRGTSLSAIDALVALCVDRGEFRRDEQGILRYLPDDGSEAFHVTMMSRKGLLPEADFYHTMPYEPLYLCTPQAISRLIATLPREKLLDATYELFTKELAACDPAYAKQIGLTGLTLEAFSHAYFREREEHDPFVWAARNLEEAKANQAKGYTVPWRYAILRMHEAIGRIAPHLLAEDHARFNRYFKAIFVDDYATVPHESIERLLAVHAAGKLNILRLDGDYQLDTEHPATGAVLTLNGQKTHFPAFIEATGQRALSICDFPFPSLHKQGVITTATAQSHDGRDSPIGGIALDPSYHPVSEAADASRLYCLSIPFMLGQFPFAQGITSSHDMGKQVAQDLMGQIAQAC